MKKNIIFAFWTWMLLIFSCPIFSQSGVVDEGYYIDPTYLDQKSFQIGNTLIEFYAKSRINFENLIDGIQNLDNAESIANAINKNRLMFFPEEPLCMSLVQQQPSCRGDISFVKNVSHWNESQWSFAYWPSKACVMHVIPCEGTFSAKIERRVNSNWEYVETVQGGTGGTWYYWQYGGSYLRGYRVTVQQGKCNVTYVFFTTD